MDARVCVFISAHVASRLLLYPLSKSILMVLLQFIGYYLPNWIYIASQSIQNVTCGGHPHSHQAPNLMTFWSIHFKIFFTDTNFWNFYEKCRIYPSKVLLPTRREAAHAMIKCAYNQWSPFYWDCAPCKIHWLIMQCQNYMSTVLMLFCTLYTAFGTRRGHAWIWPFSPTLPLQWRHMRLFKTPRTQ